MKKSKKSKGPATKISGSANDFGEKSQNHKLKFKILLLFIFTSNFYLFTFAVCLSHAQTVSSAELIEKAKALDGKTVTYRGEVVTGVLKRGDHAWVNLNDGTNAIGVWCDREQLFFIRYAGSYKETGDILEVDGAFNRACQVHGGELDIHAANVRLAKPGRAIARKRVDKEKFLLPLVSFSATAILIFLFRKRA